MSYSRIISGAMTWGVWGKNMTTNQMTSYLEYCIEKGVTTFDHADIYGDYTTEKEFGKALKQSGVERNSIQLISKCGIQLISHSRSNIVKHYNYSKDYIINAAFQSVKYLQTDYLDLLLLHRPSPLLQVDDVVEAFHFLNNEGIVKQFGVSNFSVNQMQIIDSEVEIVSNQIEISLTKPEMLFNGVLDYAMNKKQIPMAWSPLGTYFKQQNGQIHRISELLKSICTKYGASEEQILLAWLLKHPAKIHPVVGTTNPLRMDRAVGSISIDLELEDWFLLLEASNGHPVP
jgi:predicted oxidoreductase